MAPLRKDHLWPATPQRDVLAPHDVRTPLHAIKGNLEIVLSDTGLALPAQARHSLAQILEATAELERALARAGLLGA
ncbi:hypothetical protein SAMN07250955_12037 [Arboricoccus pini]|uniref:histidine kinase n=1 Tax=Arboricoccus pini TaxID=1963835 RepID=A0A212S2C3_9PROT|nr:histidine kinase dimerization/phospho-acceptor domain-containing protein [Arboricoccus pini]SNB79154.1 hypothetical protein SAMN07250955_12037 [Arboricoccus pini]